MKKKLSRSQFLRVMLFWWKKWESSLSMMERRLKEAKEEIGQWSKKYQNSEKEKEELYTMKCLQRSPVSM